MVWTKGYVSVYPEMGALIMKKSGKFLTWIVLAGLLALPLGLGEASVEKHVADEANYKMSYPIVYVDRNQEAQDRINSDIYQYIAGFRDDYAAGKFTRGRFSYQVQYEDGTLLSLTLADFRYSQGAAHGYTNTRGLTYSKVTGEKLLLPYFVRISTADKSLILSQPIYNSRNEPVPLSKTFANDSFMWDKLKISDNYFLEGGGKISLIYRPYELGCYALGTLRVELSPKVIAYLNRKN